MATRPSLGTLRLAVLSALWCVVASSGKSKVPEAFVNLVFKIYQADTDCSFPAGARELIFPAGIGGTFMGALTENYVAQQLSAIGYPLHY